MRILLATSELYPLIKTGGLADASAGLVHALRGLGQDVLVVLPAYSDVLKRCERLETVAHRRVPGCTAPRSVEIIRGECPGFDAPLLLVAIDDLFARPGNPYQGPDGCDWWDNGERFGLFSRVVAEIAMDRVGLEWRAEVVHSHDWQTGLVPAWLAREGVRPRTVFTIHNLSYPGLFPQRLFDELGLPANWWHYEKAEFYGLFSLLKTGIVFADQVTTVSPTYAEEICDAGQAYGLHGILCLRREQGRLHGILNGMDTEVWNPAADTLIPYRYNVSRGRVAQKKRNKEALLERLGGGAEQLDQPLCGFIGRLVDQKGIDLILAAIPELITTSSANFVLVGTGMAHYEAALRELAERYPQRVFIFLGYDEALAHLVEAGSDIFFMPSRFEPCGLNQMYSLAYGTLPIVHATGGLSDTVVDATAEAIAEGRATGFVFTDPTPAEFLAAVLRALELYQRPRIWQAVQKTAMNQDFTWDGSARRYLELYSGA
ncbi:MAG: glycogen synthase GlgA [Desulfuromonas sp.]|nr:MAG: glycogen synthase GlgA [Desulfuromonas sp.]